MARLSHKVDLRRELTRSLPGDSGNNQEPSCPYQVARKYLKSSVPGPISSKSLLRDFWKTPQCSNDSCWWESRGRRRRRQRRGGERWAVVFDYNKMLHLVSLILQLNGKKTQRGLLRESTFFKSWSWITFLKYWKLLTVSLWSSRTKSSCV